jgi:CheY-like chemotaxis protein
MPACIADPGQLETSLIKLATNARDAMPQGGRLLLSSTSETVATQHPAGLDPRRYVRFSVADTAIGMDAATLARAAEPFYTTKAAGAGTGLGLSMVKGFAEQSGGGLSIASTPGQGTTVTFWLPEAHVDAAAPRPAPTRVPDELPCVEHGTRPIQVLLVDDEAPVREALAMQLQDAGSIILAASGGREALDLLDGGEPVHVLVADLSMPGMDGLGVIRAVNERLPDLPALLLTGYAGDGGTLARRLATDGSFSLLRKPASARDLVGRLHTLLAGQPDTASRQVEIAGQDGERQLMR